MDTIKQIVVKVIPSNIANDFIKKHHYSGKVVNNSQLHFGCFLNNVLHGVLSYGCPLDKRKVLHLVLDKKNKPALWNEMLELNRMAFDEALPKYSESRCIGITLRLIKKERSAYTLDIIICRQGHIAGTEQYIVRLISN